MNMEKTNVMRELEVAHIPYIPHYYPVDEDHLDGMHVAASLNENPEQIFKTLVCIDPKNNIAVFCIPVNCEMDLKKAAKAAHFKSISLLPLMKLTSITGYIRGGCSPIGMKKRFPTYIDETAILFHTIMVSGGKRGVQVELDPNDLITFIDGSYHDLVQD